MPDEIATLNSQFDRLRQLVTEAIEEADRVGHPVCAIHLSQALDTIDEG